MCVHRPVPSVRAASTRRTMMPPESRRGALSFLTALAVVAVGAVLFARERDPMQLEAVKKAMPPAPKRAAGTSTPLTYTLHLGCESDDVIAKYPSFFGGDYTENIVEARIVFHNYNVRSRKGSNKFFKWKHGLVMNKVNLQTADSLTFELTTNKINYEYGFALMNKDGQVLYEIGKKGESLLEGDCAYAFGPYRNRVITSDWKRAKDLGFIDATFGRCAANCMPGDVNNPWDWDATLKDKGSTLMKNHPPTGLGGQFIMYGVNRDGICTMNLHTQRGTCDDILTHFDPRPKENRFITDNKRCDQWQGQLQEITWKAPDLGSVQENDETKWKFTFQYHTDGLNVLLNDVYYTKYQWNSQDGGYNTISYIQIEYLNDKHFRQGTPWADPESSEPHRSGTHGCRLLALMPPRTPLGAAAFQEP